MEQDKLETLIKELRSEYPDVRSQALDSLGLLHPEGSLETIIPFLNDPVADVRGTAALSLGMIQEPSALPYLLAYLDHETNEDARSFGFMALEYYPEPSALEYLIKEIGKPKVSRLPRQHIAEVLRYFNSESAVDTLISLFQEDNDAFVKQLAAESLLRLNRPRLQRFWEAATSQRSKYVQNIAMQALSQLDGGLDSLVET